MIAQGLIGNPHGLFVDPEGNILVATESNTVVIVESREGKVVGTLGGMTKTFGVVMDGKGRVIVADWGAHQIHIF